MEPVLDIANVFCPHCEQLVPLDAPRCPFCVQPLHAVGGGRHPGPIDSGPSDSGTGAPLLDRPWVLVVLLLHVGVLGIPVYWRSRRPLGTRLCLVVASILYTIGAVAVIVWGLRQIVQLVQSGG